MKESQGGLYYKAQCRCLDCEVVQSGLAIPDTFVMYVPQSLSLCIRKQGHSTRTSLTHSKPVGALDHIAIVSASTPLGTGCGSTLGCGGPPSRACIP